ncbi:MAG: hypothetical protein ABS75_24105 [Pelagibacterium sp. SCN 63-23]|nr:MAG: hypothetical protein ABS75_24105 [Pelagibacterium sp. SCN 63-23]
MTRKIKPPIALYSALADATRCRIVEILMAGPIPVHKLADAFAISRPAISRHLRVLKTAGLVAEVKKGRENLYALRPDKLGRAVGWIEAVSGKTAPVPAAAAPVAEKRAIALPQVEVAAMVEPDLAPAEKPVRGQPRTKRPEPVSQMGFDF